MSSGVAHVLPGSIGWKLFSTVFVTLLVTSGLLMAPVSCMCGASVPHGHSLFQLPFHSHAGANHSSGTAHDHSSHEASGDGAATQMATPEDECDDGPGKTHDHQDGTRYVALSNAMEKNDGAALQAPPSSSVGQPIAITQPTLITLPGEECETLTLPPARVLKGLETSPETPPPRAAVFA